ncbi:MAG: phosphate signaling complex protein PhoU [Thermoanaerobaculia bacterium]|nr:phosphate signaling complex protein PhoU [Thermoanaerobaculia bacterium]
MHRHFDDEISHLMELLLRMGAEAEDAVAKSIRAFEERDVALAEAVIARDDEVDRHELEIDQYALELIAKMQPAAGDLRVIATIMKATPEIERIADLAQDVCERVVELGAEPPLKNPDVLPLARAAQRMLRDALEALVNRDAALAREVIARDDEADQLTEQSFREHLTYMLEDARNISPMIRRTFVAKYFERIADGATNICELVVWLVEGNVVKHAGV